MKPTYRLLTGDARQLDWLPDESVHLVVTSPPYWTLKEYNENPDQLGAVADYDCFMDQLDQVWKHCWRALVAGGRLVCVVGDVCLSRKKNRGRHMVVPLHADISVRCRQIGFDYLTPIFWHKIANAKYEVENGSSFLGCFRSSATPCSTRSRALAPHLSQRLVPIGTRSASNAIRRTWRSPSGASRRP